MKNALESGELMTMETKYSSVMTGAAFMLYEFRQLVMLKEQGDSDGDIRKKVISENVFQYEKISSIKRALPSILRRINAIDGTLRKMVLEESLEFSKAINLYAIMKTDCLFYEFMNEVIGEKLQTDNYSFEKKDLNLFFTIKAEQDEGICGWTEATIQKLKQVYNKILLETGLLRDHKTGELTRLVLDEQLKRHLLLFDDAKYVRAIGE